MNEQNALNFDVRNHASCLRTLSTTIAIAAAIVAHITSPASGNELIGPQSHRSLPPSTIEVAQLTEPEGAPVLSEPEGGPVLTEPEGAPVLSEPEGEPVLAEPPGQPMLTEPDTAPHEHYSTEQDPGRPNQPGVQPQIGVDQAQPAAPPAQQSAGSNLSGRPTGRLEACTHDKKKTRKHVWQTVKSDVGATAYIAECPSCEMGLAVVCNARLRTLELSVPWLAMENGQAGAPITFDVCIDGEGAEFHGTTEHQGMIGYLPKMNIIDAVAKSLTEGSHISVRFQGQWAHFRLKGSKTALEKMAALCR